MYEATVAPIMRNRRNVLYVNWSSASSQITKNYKLCRKLSSVLLI